MVVGYHIVFGAYGFWLPNDPRGSWSKFVASDALYNFAGPATTTGARRSLARNTHDRSERRAAKRQLLRAPVRFTTVQQNVIGHGFAQYFKNHECPVWACAVMPNHVHLVVGQPANSLDRFVAGLKSAAVHQLNLKACHPFENETDARGLRPLCFVRRYWLAFLEWDDLKRSVNYVENNRQSSVYRNSGGALFAIIRDQFHVPAAPKHIGDQRFTDEPSAAPSSNRCDVPRRAYSVWRAIKRPRQFNRTRPQALKPDSSQTFYADAKQRRKC